MTTILNNPFLVFAIALLAQGFAVYLGGLAGAGIRRLNDDERKDFDVVQGATLTLLGLIIGFSFSMAIARYDLRKNYEEVEANAIATEYARAGLLPAADVTALRANLRRY